MADKEYIEREFAIQLLEEHMTDAAAKSKTMVKDIYLMAKNHAKDYLSIIPAADVVEVVRCKNCTEWNEAEGECSHWYGFRENDFCSYGERKE